MLVFKMVKEQEDMSACAIGSAIGGVGGSVQWQTDPVCFHGTAATEPFETGNVSLIDLMQSDP